MTWKQFRRKADRPCDQCHLISFNDIPFHKFGCPNRPKQFWEYFFNPEALPERYSRAWWTIMEMSPRAQWYNFWGTWRGWRGGTVYVCQRCEKITKIVHKNDWMEFALKFQWCPYCFPHPDGYTVRLNWAGIAKSIRKNLREGQVFNNMRDEE